MQELKSDNKLDIVETVSVIGSIGGAIASLVLTKLHLLLFLSISVALNLLNRRRLLEASSQNNQTAIAQIVRTRTSRASWDASLNQLSYSN